MLLSGLRVRHFQKPLAGMVICGSGPYLNNELRRSTTSFDAHSLILVFPIQICSIILPIQVFDSLHLLYRRQSALRYTVVM